ncbi:hypothetical protein PR202_ga30244 [Eleusine coracana subsp. coracana]|uniref:Uncharacterized protein n=1 Tax=Eleusine coracana subsp. coracana TaxID=191504 RepID=A0AAV5DN95_ELECO|nr:hypothetical protein PR202_ga30244 [Eleusine coracana subsp. coracana]
MGVREHAFAVEQERLLSEIEFLKREHGRRLEIALDSIKEIRRSASLKDQMVELLERKESEVRDPAFDELEDNYLEYSRSLISTLADENTELKKKLKEIESQAELSENTVDHRRIAKDSKADVRKLKQVYKTMVSEKNKEISAISAETAFAWNQFKSMEKESRDTIISKDIEIKQANEAAEELYKTVCELRLEVQEKDGEIGRLQAEVVSVKNELEQMRSLVKSKDAETNQPETTSQNRKKDLNETNIKSKLEGPVSREISRIPNATPVRREVKTSRKCVSSAKGTWSGDNFHMHNTEGRRQSDTSQKRKRGSYTLSHVSIPFYESSALFHKAASQTYCITHAFHALFHYSEADCPDPSPALKAPWTQIC